MRRIPSRELAGPSFSGKPSPYVNTLPSEWIKEEVFVELQRQADSTSHPVFNTAHVVGEYLQFVDARRSPLNLQHAPHDRRVCILVVGVYWEVHVDLIDKTDLQEHSGRRLTLSALDEMTVQRKIDRVPLRTKPTDSTSDRTRLTHVDKPRHVDLIELRLPQRPKHRIECGHAKLHCYHGV